MRNVWLIAKREYLERVRTKSFIIATAFIPLLMGGILLGTGFLAAHTKSAARIAILTTDKLFADQLKHQLETNKNSEVQVTVGFPSESARTRLDHELTDKNSNLTGYLTILPPLEQGHRARFIYKPRSASDIGTEAYLKENLGIVLLREGLFHQGINPNTINHLMEPVEIDTSQTGDSQKAFYAAYTLFLLMYMGIALYGMNTARSIIEEKSSRIFEVLLSTVKPDELLAGKLIGVGAVGLTQTAVWMGAISIISAYFTLASTGSKAVLVSNQQTFFFIAYFIFGFMVYSSIAVALGAITSSEQELQQLNMFLMLPLIFCMLMLLSVIKNPDSTLSRVVSLVPFCSPLLMNLRISVGRPQAWEILLSFVLMTITVCSILWISSRIYRVGVLMYGKRPNLPEIIRWFRYS